MEKNIIEKLAQTRDFIFSKTRRRPEIGIILGSGLDRVSSNVASFVSFSFKVLPNMPQVPALKPRRELIIGSLFGRDVAVLNGRLHFYEGFSIQDTVYPVRLMKTLGVRTVIITAATGGMDKKFREGDLVFLKDQINLMGVNPLVGNHNDEFGSRFPDMTNIYDADITSLCASFAKKNRIRSYDGVYTALSGPSYETPAEIRAFKKLGGDVVGMSVVPEAIAAHQMGLRVIGISYISNMASGLSRGKLSHENVLKIGKTVSDRLLKVLKFMFGII